MKKLIANKACIVGEKLCQKAIELKISVQKDNDYWERMADYMMIGIFKNDKIYERDTKNLAPFYYEENYIINYYLNNY